MNYMLALNLLFRFHTQLWNRWLKTGHIRNRLPTRQTS